LLIGMNQQFLDWLDHRRSTSHHQH
jgi:hypothetical protein